MSVKFKKGLGLSYKVIDANPQIKYSENLNKFCDHIELQLIGWAELELLEQAGGEEIDVVDVMVRLSV